MKERRFSLIIGLVLSALGVVFLLGNLNLISFSPEFVVGLIFAAGGAAFLLVFATGREEWWAAIPGSALLGLGALIVTSAILPELGGFGGSIFLGSASLGFWLVYLARREQWWAVIPGGVLLTLACVAGLSGTIGGELSGGLFFLGLALTFGLVYVLPTPEGRMKWAIYPAVILAALGFCTAAAGGDLPNLFWPVILILAGVYLLARRGRGGGAKAEPGDDDGK
ncbi:MAG: hypothetical protein ACM3X6_00685 [Patescibacteria group bacterium]